MTRVAILPVPTPTGGIDYHAIAGAKRSQGKTAGEALDALTAQLSEDESGTLIVIQEFRPDRLFSADQRKRLSELMARWREARDGGGELLAAEQTELDDLIEAEIRASAERTTALLHELDR